MKHIISFSGGKDSTAMLLRMIELGMPIDEIVFADTNFEFPELYEYIKKIENHIGREIKILKPNKNFWNFAGEQVTRGKNKGKIRGMPLRAFPCWWTREAKVLPLQKLRKQEDVLFYVGIAYDEKERMSKVDENIRYPLIDWKWTEQDCMDYLNQKGLFNPLYVNFNRLGCFHCPKQSESSLYVVWKNYPDLWVKMKTYEKWNLNQTGNLVYNRSLIELEKLFEKGKIPKTKPKYNCWNGCESVKKAFKERQCGVFDFV